MVFDAHKFSLNLQDDHILFSGFEACPKCTPSTPSDKIQQIAAKGFGKPHTNFGVLLSMHACVMTVELCACVF